MADPRVCTVDHGITRYTRYGCRCAARRQAWAAYCRTYRAAKRAKGICARCSTTTEFYLCTKHRRAQSRYDLKCRGGHSHAA